MATQSRAQPVPLLLTRPATQGAGFASDLRARFGERVRCVETPLLFPRFFAPALPDGPFGAVILTSQTGVAAFARLGGQKHELPVDVFCVGARTANAAQAVGLRVVAVAPDAASLIRQIVAHPPAGRMVHLRGREARGDVKENLNSAGIDTVDAVIYAQEPLPLTTGAVDVLLGTRPVLVPLFSPRTAAIFSGELQRVQGVAPLFVAAMSDDVALELHGIAPQIRIAATPDAAAVLGVLDLLLADIQRA